MDNGPHRDLVGKSIITTNNSISPRIPSLNYLLVGQQHAVGGGVWKMKSCSQLEILLSLYTLVPNYPSG